MEFIFFIEARYNPDKAMDDLGFKKTYNAVLLCVSRSFRGRGLGKEMLRRSYDIAREQGAEAMYIMATGKYSQAIFRKEEFTVQKEFPYLEIKNPKGGVLFDGHGEHEKIEIVYKKM